MLRAGGVGRLAAVAVLLAVTVAGLRAGAAFSHAPHPGAVGFGGPVLVTALTAGEGVAFLSFLIVVAMMRPRRRVPSGEEPWRLRVPWWLRTLALLASAFAIAAPFAILVAKRARHRVPAPFLMHPGLPHTGAGQPITPTAGSSWPVIAGMVIAIAVVVTVVLRSRTRRPAGWSRPRYRAAGLAESLAAGRAALEGRRDPRQAIIACYAAMERGFAAAGSAPAAADTPAEVLARAAGAGLVRSPSAEALTGLFRRARYSAEPMTSADSASAASALAEMDADLRAVSS